MNNPVNTGGKPKGHVSITESFGHGPSLTRSANWEPLGKHTAHAEPQQQQQANADQPTPQKQPE